MCRAQQWLLVEVVAAMTPERRATVLEAIRQAGEAALQEAVAARDAAIKRHEDEIGKAEADTVGLSSSGSQREELATQVQQASRKVVSLERQQKAALSAAAVIQDGAASTRRTDAL